MTETPQKVPIPKITGPRAPSSRELGFWMCTALVVGNMIGSGVFMLPASLLEQQRQGAITRKLAAWAAILAVPTAVAGIYGMNFEHMPELKWTWGYPAVMTGIVAVIGWLYWRFKKNGWL